MSRLRLAIFASGGGSNAESIMRSCESNELDCEVRLVVASKPSAGVISRAKAHGVPVQCIAEKDYDDRKRFNRALLNELRRCEADFIALAGYMKIVHPEIIGEFENRITNIHPALLPSFGGKGYYGIKVHEAVLNAGCKVTGVTVHIVNEEYDRGPIVAQRSVPVREDDTPETLAARVLKEEHRIYPYALQLFAEDRVEILGKRVMISGVE